MNYLSVLFGFHCNFVDQCIVQRLDIPLGTIVAATQLGKDTFEVGVVTQFSSLPDCLGRALQGTNSLHLGSAQSSGQRFRHQWPQDVNGITHFGNHAVAETEATLFE